LILILLVQEARSLMDRAAPPRPAEAKR